MAYARAFEKWFCFQYIIAISVIARMNFFAKYIFYSDYNPMVKCRNVFVVKFMCSKELKKMVGEYILQFVNDASCW